MNRLTTLLLLAFVPVYLSAGPASADDPPAPPKADKIRFPDPPKPPAPPPPAPGLAELLPQDYLYVIDSDVQLMAVSIPAGIVRIAGPEAGPVKMRAKFVGGSGEVETKTFGGKYVYTVDYVRPGLTNLIVFPVGIKNPSEMIQKQIQTVTAPQPPPPDPPAPPTPVPPPTPPTPVDPAPIPADGNRVLIVYETADLTNYPAAQTNVLYAKQVRDYLRSKCVVGPDGKTREWRIYDKDLDLSGESPLWRDAMKRDRKSLPWIVISTGKTGYEGPLPADVPSTLALLKKYFGE